MHRGPDSLGEPPLVVDLDGTLLRSDLLFETALAFLRERPHRFLARGRPTNYLYGSAKAAVSVFLEGLRARPFRAGVRVTDIRPGFVATPMTRDLALPAALVAEPDAVARRIVARIERGADVVYAPAFWALVMAVIRSIPGPVFKRLRL